jgi:putative heme transporter
VVLNIIFWTGLIVSIPFRGVNPLYGVAALAGVVIMCLAAGLVIGVMDGSGRAERLVRWIARKLRLDPDRFAAVLHQVGDRLEELTSDRALLRSVVFWATVNWLLDAASLYVFLRAFGGSLSIDALIVAFGLANVLAAIPILPGGLGVVEATYLTALVGFGIPRRVAAPAVATYRAAQYLMPIALGGLAYASLRVGPWKIERRDRLVRLRDLARAEAEKGESRIDFALRFGGRRPPAGGDPDDSDPGDPY